MGLADAIKQRVTVERYLRDTRERLTDGRASHAGS